MAAQVVALFVKPPVPGRVKTRLARDIGDDAACRVYRQLADNVLKQAVASQLPVVLFHDGDDPGLLPADWRAAVTDCRAQSGDDLGERMRSAFVSLFVDQFDRVVLAGSDIPDLDADCISAAFRYLDEVDIVIGPSVDGGYYLIGASRKGFSPVLFRDISWSSATVLAETLERAESAGILVALLEPLTDIDTLDDLRRFPGIVTDREDEVPR